jgi:1,2-phenylacetyl-CoA epoxidase catalytic subunit
VTASGEDAVELRAHGEHGVAAAHVDYVLGLGDDALVSAQRLGWWISRAPQLEEDLALANIGLDQLGQARTLLAHAGAIEGHGRSGTTWRTSATSATSATSGSSSAPRRTSASPWRAC